jgi:hypothetical protein
MSVATEETTADVLLRLMTQLELELAKMGKFKAGSPWHADRARELERLRARYDLLPESAK